MQPAFEEAQRRYFEAEGIAPRSRFVDVRVPGATLRTHVLDMGDGPPLVLLHGGGGLAAAWAPLMRRLADFRLVAPDRPGGGWSAAFDYRGVDLRVHAIQWVRGVFDACQLDRAVIIANSMGARWATWFALAHPERVGGLAALGTPAFLLNSSAPLPLRLLGTRWLGPRMMAMEKPSPPQALRLWRRMGHPPSMPSPELVALTIAL